VVVAGNQQHSSARVAARHVAVPQRVPGAVHAGTFAIPQGEHAVAAEIPEDRALLRTPDSGRGQILVQARLEVDIVSGKVVAGLPELLVHPAQWRTAVSGDEARRAQALAPVALTLHQQQPNQCLKPGHVDTPLGERVLVFQADRGYRHGVTSARAVRIVEAPAECARARLDVLEVPRAMFRYGQG